MNYSRAWLDTGYALGCIIEVTQQKEEIMASRESQLVVSMMKSANVTANEALAFMGQSLTIM